MDWHKELERSLTSQGESSLYDSAQYSASLLQVRSSSYSSFSSSFSSSSYSSSSVL